MNRLKQIKRLRDLTQLKLQYAQMELQSKMAAENACRATLLKLEDDRKALMPNLTIDEDTSPCHALCNGKWLKWAERQRATTNMKLARARADTLELRKAATKALGRDQVVDALDKRLKS